MKFNEQYTVENHIIKFISATLGYEYIRPEIFSKLREFENEFLISSHLLVAIQRINEISEDEAQSVLREVKKIDSNEDFLRLYRSGVNLKDPVSGKMRDYKVIDLRNPENNQFVVTNQFYFEGNLENIRPDIMIFVNGIPLIDIEAKSPTASTLVDYSKAVGQLKRYEKNAHRLFWPNCFSIATDGIQTVYGATYSPLQHFLQWKDEDLETLHGGNVEMSIAALLTKETLLDIISNFIVFEKTTDGRIKKIARYQQFRATNKIIERVKQGEKKRGLVWHTQGSGKSLTMFFTAWKLRFDTLLHNPKVFILVDRIDLDDQIFDTFMNCGGENVTRVTSRKDLEEKIQNSERGIFISTIQKFSELGPNVENTNENIIVLSDEAHRDNEGISAINLRTSLHKAFLFGFTGTPIDKLTLNTHRNFGEDGERYLDYYSIQEAIDDGATLPVTYEARLSKFSINEEKVDQQFDEMTTDLTDSQKEALSKKFGKKAALVKLTKRMESVAQDIIEHFKLYVAPNGFKAQVVCFDREATAKYKVIFDRLISPEFSAVIYSPGDPNDESDDLKVYNTNKQEREQLITRFKDPKNPLQFLLVCDMLLTGFDAPIEQVMYLDKPLRDHNLLQAIARTNRVYPNKGAGKIIDYYGITKNLYDALDFDESIVDSALININQLKEQFIQILSEIMELFTGINIEDPSMDNLRRALKIFTENERKQNYFVEKYGKLKLLFEILSPDPFLSTYLRQFEWITSFYLAFKKTYQDEDDNHAMLAEYGEKVKKIIQEEIDYEGITRNFKELTVNDIYVLNRLHSDDEEEKALQLEKIIKHEIQMQIDSDPSFEKFSLRLLSIRDEFEKQQIDLSERIKRYFDLLNDLKSKSEEAKHLGLTLQEMGMYRLLQEYSLNPDDDELLFISKSLTQQLSSLLDKNWQDSSKREEFIKIIKQVIQESLLKTYKGKIHITDFSKMLNRFTDVIVKKF
ncbi:MAG: type I restriction endonuclease subunit R [Candidatus Woesebacteria bacterium]